MKRRLVKISCALAVWMSVQGGWAGAKPVATAEGQVNLQQTSLEDSTSFSEWIEAGDRYYSQREYEQAIACYSKAIAINSNDAKLYHSRGIVYFQIRDYWAARIDYDKAIELDSQYSASYNNRGQLRFAMGDHSGAIEDCTQAIELKPQSAWNYYSRGLCYYKMEEWNLALADFNKAIESDPDYTYAYYYGSIIKGLQKQYQQAIDDLTKAVQVDPEYVAAYIVRGKLYNASGSVDLAIKDYSKAINLQPLNGYHDYSYYHGQAHYYRAHAYLEKNKNKLAEADFIAAALNPTLYGKSLPLLNYYRVIGECSEKIAVEPEQAKYYITRGREYQELAAYLGEDKNTYSNIVASRYYYNMAQKDLNRGVALGPHDMNGYLARSNFYKMLKKFDKAQQDLDKAVEIRPYETTGYLARSSFYAELEKFDKVLADHSKIIELDPLNGYFGRGNYYFLLKNYNLAIHDYSSAIELIPGANFLHLLHYLRGNAYYHVQQYEQALLDYDRCLELNSESKKIYYEKALILEEVGRKQDAIAAYHLFLGDESLEDKIRYSPSYKSEVEYARERLALLAEEG